MYAGGAHAKTGSSKRAIGVVQRRITAKPWPFCLDRLPSLDITVHLGIARSLKTSGRRRKKRKRTLGPPRHRHRHHRGRGAFRRLPSRGMGFEESSRGSSIRR